MTGTREDAPISAPASDVTDARAGTPRPSGLKGWLTWGWRTLTSMRTALILLFLLALAAIPGSVVPQQGVNPAGVVQYYKAHPALAPWLNHLGLFNVFAAPWFAAVYLLLFASLIGCVLPRALRLARSARTPPPRAPGNITRLPHHAVYPVALAPERAVDVAAAVLRRRGFRLRRDPEWVSAEKGYLREAGNLLFHLALLGVLASIALGGLFGYKADKVLVEGGTFADAASSLDEFHPGRLVTGSDLPPFTITLRSFNAAYHMTGPDRGQPSSFDAKISYTTAPGAQPRSYDLRVNQPLSIDGVKVYLLGHGFAPVFKVTDARGRVVYDQATVFIPDVAMNNLSQGVVKVPGASPSQLGFAGAFVPTAIPAGGALASVFPAPANPMVSLTAYAGNLGMDSGAPQSVYQLNTSQMRMIAPQAKVLTPGQSWNLRGYGTITFAGYRQWVSLQATHDPGQLPALVSGILALGGLVLSFLVRRRRVFVRAAAAGSGSVVTVGGLARADPSGGFAQEFAGLAGDLRHAHQAAADGTASPPGDHQSGGQ